MDFNLELHLLHLILLLRQHLQMPEDRSHLLMNHIFIPFSSIERNMLVFFNFWIFLMAFLLACLHSLRFILGFHFHEVFIVVILVHILIELIFFKELLVLFSWDVL